jgi:hypothetical protein
MFSACDFSNALWGPIVNAATGNQTDCQTQAIIEKTQEDIQAGEDRAVYYGTLDEETAQQIADTGKAAAAGDITAISAQNNKQCATTLPLLGCVTDWNDFLVKAKQDLVYIFIGLFLLVLGIWFVERKLGI